MLVCLVTFLVMFLPRPRQLTALGKEGMYVEDQQATESPSPYLGGKRRRGRSLSQEGEEVYQQPGSYMGFHRPLGVVPPSSSPGVLKSHPVPKKLTLCKLVKVSLYV